MPEPRFDPLGRRWILLAPERAGRGVPSGSRIPPDPAPCDFCGGREDRTPPEVLRVPAPDGGWWVRVVPNLYPATETHEVIVHTPDHDARFEDLPPEHRAAVWRTYRDRAAASGAPATVVGVNRGATAGASRSHDHAQVFGLPLVPPTLAREAEALDAEPCVVCSIADEQEHLVATHGAVRLVTHPVPLLPHELLVVGPCEPRLEEASDEVCGDAASAAADGIRRLRGVLTDDLAFNLAVHTAPRAAGGFHWHAHVYPRTARWGVLELGAELPIVAADPRDTAERLRQDG